MQKVYKRFTKSLSYFFSNFILNKVKNAELFEKEIIEKFIFI